MIPTGLSDFSEGSTTNQCAMALPLWNNSPTFCPLLSTNFWNFWQGHQAGEHHVGAGAQGRHFCPSSLT